MVATDTECHRHLRYEAISQTHCFIPVAVEMLGAIGEEVTAFFKDLGGRIAATMK